MSPIPLIHSSVGPCFPCCLWTCRTLSGSPSHPLPDPTPSQPLYVRQYAPPGISASASTLCTLTCHSHVPAENASADMEMSNKILHSLPAFCKTGCAEFVSFSFHMLAPLGLAWLLHLIAVISFCPSITGLFCLSLYYKNNVFLIYKR